MKAACRAQLTHRSAATSAGVECIALHMVGRFKSVWSEYTNVWLWSVAAQGS